ncbi:MAG: 4-hydroxythreonine-4-phosphate dehydrogenase PdxA [Candidatus Oxydemutatoraceae bacterium WSBS_2016_MAG_OTU14]
MSQHSIVTSGDPAGVGPDICLALAHHELRQRLVVAGDIDFLKRRAQELKLEVKLYNYEGSEGESKQLQQGCLNIHHIPATHPIKPGQMNPDHTDYVLEQINFAIDHCLEHHFEAMVTAPVNKAAINQAGVAFSGHTEYLAQRCDSPAVMTFDSNPSLPTALRIALLTTHLPLQEVTRHINQENFQRTLLIVYEGLKKYFHIAKPRLGICGINPHAGENGYLGSEEQEILQPVIQALRQQGLDLSDPLPADTIFTPQRQQNFDLIVTMFHDQGLPVMKAICFGDIVNITLGLPFLRTSVDHGTAYDAAEQKKSSPKSLIYAVQWTQQALAYAREYEACT